MDPNLDFETLRDAMTPATEKNKQRIDLISIQEIDFDRVKECSDHRVIKRYLELLDEEPMYPDLAKACEDKLAELDPKAHRHRCPPKASAAAINEATNDISSFLKELKAADESIIAHKNGGGEAPIRVASNPDAIFEGDHRPAKVAAVREQPKVQARPNVLEEGEDKRPEAEEHEQLKKKFTTNKIFGP